MSRRMLLTGVALVVAAITAGCGESDGLELVRVRGKVLLDDQPLSDALVTFQPELGRPSVGTTNANGEYELSYTPDKRGAVPGRHTVVISTFIEPDSDSDDPARQAGQPERVPESYNRQSTLQVEVSSDRDEPYDFPLKSAES